MLVPTALLLLIVIFPEISLAPTVSPGVQSPHSVPLSQIVNGGPPPDGIPSIDNPVFVPATTATFVFDDQLVIGVSYGGEAKAYPLLILVWHEIVNDVINGTPVAVTYCPLCFSTLAFVRVVDGQTVTFGTSGKLYDDNLVMYDRSTKTLWSQMWGQAIAGNLTGKSLQRIPIDVMPWGAWKKLYPNTLVLSDKTGYSRPYGIDPYDEQGYYDLPYLLFPLDHQDNRLPVKARVLGVVIHGVSRAYPLGTFNSTGVVQDEVGNQSVALFSIGNGSARAFAAMANGVSLRFSYQNGAFVDKETGSRWSYGGAAVSGPLSGQTLQRYVTVTSFWFAWATFYPGTSVYGEP